MEKRVRGKEGVSVFSVENLLSDSTEKLRRGNLPSVSQSFSGIDLKDYL